MQKRSSMEKYRFTSKNGYCPECIAFGRRWYIQNRELGGGTYEYCLMSLSQKKPMQYIFCDKKELAKWLNDDKNDTEYDEVVADFLIARWIDCDFYDKALIIHHGIQYVYDKHKNTLTVITERKQETGWFNSYRECLKIAKEILQNQNRKMRTKY